MAKSQKKTVLFVLIVTALDTAGLGIIYPVLPKLIEDLAHTDISTAATYGGWLTFAYALMQFFFAPVLGNLSDRYGRTLTMSLQNLQKAMELNPGMN